MSNPVSIKSPVSKSHFKPAGRLFLVIGLLLTTVLADAQDVFVSSSSTISFFSETPVENIDATSKQAVGAINIKKRSVFFKVKMSTFEFKKALMQEHFNENYIESAKYPYATFNGTINEPVDLSKDGSYEVTATGKLSLHGVDQDRTVPATIVVKDGKLDVTSAFEVKVADHQIKIPTVVVQHIAEEVKVKVHAEMSPAKQETK